MKKFFNGSKGYYLVVGVCVLAVMVASSSVVTNYIKNSNEREKALKHSTEYVNVDNINIPKKESVPIVKNETKIEKNSETKTAEPKQTEEPQEEFILEKPVVGDYIVKFSGNELIYSKTFNDYRTHNGIDIKAERSTPVKAVFKGVIEEIYSDAMEGITIVINHNNGFKSIYKNLSTEKMVKKGETVEKGQAISGIGETAVFEAGEESHLHFELLRDDKKIDPQPYL